MHLTRPIHERPWVLLCLGIIYIIGLSFFVRAQSFLTPAESWIGCTSVYWDANDGCGLNGNACEPFTNTSFNFRCPALCSSVKLQNPRAIGNEQVNFVPLIVGGGDENFTYRGDSFLCAAAIQA
jgi:LCCL domain